MSESYSEIWKDVVGYEGRYSVSNLGRVRRDAGGAGAISGKILRPTLARGYLHIMLCNNKTMRFRVHRLIAAAFIGPCPANKQVNHKNGVKTDNRPENLEYVTPQENTRHSLDVLGHKNPVGENNGRARLSELDVREIRLAVSSGEPIWSIAKKFGICQPHVWKIVSRKHWAHVP